jgi:hypothetical protein
VPFDLVVDQLDVDPRVLPGATAIAEPAAPAAAGYLSLSLLSSHLMPPARRKPCRLEKER